MNLVDVLAQAQGKDNLVGKVYGAVAAIVTNIDDPDEKGRVKVKYGWLQDEIESPWARMVSFGAANNAGGVFRPDVGAEVLVMFDHGDMRVPYVIGSLWNGADVMPSSRGADADNNIFLIRSRSGHEVILDDTPGGERVEITDANGNTIEMTSDGVTIKSGAILIGSAGSSESLVLGDAFMQLFNSHIHPTGVGPSGPPTQPMAAGQHVSTKHKTE